MGLSEMWEIKLQKSKGISLYLKGTVILKFLVVPKQKKILGYICFSEQIIHRKQSLGAPEKYRYLI